MNCYQIRITFLHLTLPEFIIVSLNDHGLLMGNEHAHMTLAILTWITWNLEIPTLDYWELCSCKHQAKQPCSSPNHPHTLQQIKTGKSHTPSLSHLSSLSCWLSVHVIKAMWGSEWLSLELCIRKMCVTSRLCVFFILVLGTSHLQFCIID